MKKNTYVVIASLIISLMCTVSIAKADPYTVNSGWADFSFDSGPGSAWGRTFEFTLTAPAILKVTDFYCMGDQYNVTDNGANLGNTSVPVIDMACSIFEGDRDVAFADANWSSGWWILQPGSYSISGTVIQAPFWGGDGAIRVDYASNCVGSLCYLSASGTGAGWHSSQCMVYVPGMMETINVGQVTYAGCAMGSCPQSFCIVVTP